MSTFMLRMLFTVSSNVSPLETEDELAVKFSESADKRFSASSKDMRVRVEFSKNKLTTVISRSEGTFLTGRCKTSLNCEVVDKISAISSLERSLMPSRCGLDSFIKKQK